MPSQKIKRAKLFVCAYCEWIFKTPNNGCPKCHYSYYIPHFVYSKKAYHNFKAVLKHALKENTNALRNSNP